MTETDRNLRRKMLDAFKVRFHDKAQKSEGYDDGLFAALEEAIAVRDAALVPVNITLIDALEKIAVAIETDDTGAVADTIWMPDDIIKGCTVVDFIRLIVATSGSNPVAWWYRDHTGCIHMGTDMMAGLRRQNEDGAALHYLFGDDPDGDTPPICSTVSAAEDVTMAKPTTEPVIYVSQEDFDRMRYGFAYTVTVQAGEKGKHFTKPLYAAPPSIDRDAVIDECIKAVDDAGGDNADYHMNAILELKERQP